MERTRSNQGLQLVRAKLIISGHVQGVYFRAAARGVARAQQLVGWVRNRCDGAVETVVEGEQSAVQRFITWCHDGPPGSHVSAVQVTMEPYAGEFPDFRIIG
jgi:acylphosphatase